VPQNCPYCEIDLDHTRDAEFQVSAPPPPGAITICSVCSQFCTVTRTGLARTTKSELTHLAATDPEHMGLLETMAEVIRRADRR
jgi:hypothetical protein